LPEMCCSRRPANHLKVRYARTRPRALLCGRRSQARRIGPNVASSPGLGWSKERDGTDFLSRASTTARTLDAATTAARDAAVGRETD
jgi:hypothetical protein